jgi:uncharacterized protein (DUF362 family)
MNRRQFLKDASTTLGAAWFASSGFAPSLLHAFDAAPSISHVAFVKTTDRAAGVKRAIDLLGMEKLRGKDLFIKPNFNSSDPTPGSTHEDTLAALLRQLKAMGAGPLTIGDRSGMGNTREVMGKKSAFQMGKELGAKVVVFDELASDDWELLKPQDSHWEQGFALPRVVRKAGGVVQTCCLKTHRFGGHFTLSLKNSVGFAAKVVPGNSYNFMRELHSSEHQRHMIAEINTGYKPDLILLDGVQAFRSGQDGAVQRDSGRNRSRGYRRCRRSIAAALWHHPGSEPGRDFRSGTDCARRAAENRHKQPEADRVGYR